MSQSICYKVAGPTQALSVANTVALASVTCNPNEAFNYIGLTNIGGAPIFVQTAGGANIPYSLSATIFPPTGGGPVAGVIVPPLMQAPMLVACPTPICNVAAISNSATASLLFITPMGNL